MTHSVKQQAGFSLIELMVALVVTLIVTLAAVSFLTSIAQASSDGIRVTRLTQELRALSEVMSREIRRARYVQDPIGLVAQGATPGIGNDQLGVNGNCFFYEYDEPPPAPSGTLVQRSIYLNNGRVFLANDLDCGNTLAGNAISSEEISIDQLQFTPTGAFQVELVIRGRLLGGNNQTQAVNRQFRQTVFIRSGQVQ